MNSYKYKVIKDTRIVTGEIDANNKKEVAEILQSQSYQVISITQKTIFNSITSLNINVGGIPSKEKTVFLRQLAYMIQAGLPINQALETMTAQVKNLQFKKVVQKVTKDVQQGQALSQALGKHDKVFDRVIINLVKAGEESGKLDEILDRLALDYEKKQEFNGKVKGALIYPGVILVVIAGVIALLMIVMIPSIKGLYADFGGKKKQLPFITTIMINLSDFLVAYWWATLIFILILIFTFNYYKKTPGGRIVVDSLVLKVPIFGNLIKLSNITDFARSLSMLLKSGVPIVGSMELISNSLSNKVFSNEVGNAAKRIEKGVILSQSLDKASPFTPIVFQMMAIGEQTGQTDTTLAKLADYYEKEVDQITNNLTKILEPIILLLMSGIVLLIALAVYLPIYSLGS